VFKGRKLPGVAAMDRKASGPIGALRRLGRGAGSWAGRLRDGRGLSPTTGCPETGYSVRQYPLKSHCHPSTQDGGALTSPNLAASRDATYTCGRHRTGSRRAGVLRGTESNHSARNRTLSDCTDVEAQARSHLSDL